MLKVSFKYNSKTNLIKQSCNKLIELIKKKLNRII